uniref:PIPK domain-containing protein n=1 Tax=Strongyloides papillosus TaxID=174720 RepID=A0A0N5BKC5_STREA
MHATRRNLRIRATPNCPEEFTRPPVADKRDIKVTMMIGSSDGSQVYDYLTKTDSCGSRFSMIAGLLDTEITKGTYYVAIFYSHNYSTFIKKIPDDCQYPHHLKESNWVCDFGNLKPYLDRKDEIKNLFEEFLKLLPNVKS